MASAGQSTEQARQAQDVDAIPTLARSARPDGSSNSSIGAGWITPGSRQMNTT